MSDVIKYPSLASGGWDIYPTFGDFPLTATDGDGAYASDTGILYVWSDNTNSWEILADISGSSGITSLNGLLGATQTFATGTTGTDFNIASSGTVHTFNIPNASATARGLVSTGAQTFAGVKTFSSIPVGPASNPTTANQLVRKAYVDAFALGLQVRASCRVATTANLTATYNNGVAGVGATLTNSGALAAINIDGVALASGNRVLVKDQSTLAQNGIYQVTTVGSGAVAWVLTRTTDYDATSEVTTGTFTSVLFGTTQANTQWVMISLGSITIGTSDIEWSQLSTPVGGGSYSDGTTIDGDGSIGDPFTLVIPVAIASGGTNNTTYTLNQVPYFDGTKLASSNDLIYDISTYQFEVGAQPTEFWGGTPSRSIWLNDGIFAYQGVYTGFGLSCPFTAIGRGAFNSSIANIQSVLGGSGSNYPTLCVGQDQTISVAGNDFGIFIGDWIQSSGGEGNAVIGSGSVVQGSQNFIFGSSSSVTGGLITCTGNIVFGGYAGHVLNGSYNQISGYGTFINGTTTPTYGSTILGGFNTLNDGFQNVIALGWGIDIATSLTGISVSNAFIAGGENDIFFGDNSVHDVYFGGGTKGLNPNSTVHLRTTDAYDTADRDATAWNFHQGLPTGAATVGPYKWFTPDAGASGTTPQSETEKMELDVLGQLKLNLYGAGTFSGTAAKSLAVDASGNVIEIAVGGGGSPGGSNTQIQYNNGGVFGGIAGFIYNGAIEANDNIFRIVDESDGTKKMNWSISGISTATTRTITALDISGTDVLSNGALTATRIPYWTASGLADAANLVWDNTNSQLTLLGTGTASRPTIGIGSTNNGFFLPSANTVGMASNGSQRFQYDATSFNSITTGGGYIRRAAGAASTPSFAFTGTVNTGMWLNGTSLGFSVAGINNFNITTGNVLQLNNPANTFAYSITPAAIAANRTLNLPLITSTDTLAVLGIAQTFSANQTFSGDLIKSSSIFVAGGNGVAANRFTCGLYTTNSPSYRLTNGGGSVTPFFMCTSSSSSSGVVGIYADSTNHLMLTHGNGTAQIAGAGLQLTNLTNTAGSEAADLIFLTHNAGAAMTQKMRISKVGNVVVGSEAALATNATDGHMYIPTCAGTPTGVPTAYTGKVAMVFDTTNSKLYVYNGAWLGGTVPGTFI